MNGPLFTNFDEFREIADLDSAGEAIEACCHRLATVQLSPETAQPFYRLLFARTLEGQTAYSETETKNCQKVYQELTFKVFGPGFQPVLTPEFVSDINRKLMAGLPVHSKTAPGEIRTHQVSLVSALDANYHIHTMDAVLCETELQKLCNRVLTFFNNRTPGKKHYEAVVYAILFHYGLAIIHPFGDANGRTARAVESYLLMAGGIPLIACNLLTNLYNHNRSEMQKAIEPYRVGDVFPEGFVRYALNGFAHLLTQVTKKAETLAENIPAHVETHRIPVYETAH